MHIPSSAYTHAAASATGSDAATDTPATEQPTASLAHLLEPRTSTKTGYKPKATAVLLVTCDLIGLLLSGFLTHLVQFLLYQDTGFSFGSIWQADNATARLVIFASLVGVGIAWFALAGHYTKRRPFWDEIAETWKIIAILAVADGLLLYLTKNQFSRFWFLGVWATALLAIPALRILIKDVLIANRLWQRPAVIVGAGDNGAQTFRALRSEPMMGLEPLAFIRLPAGDAIHHKTVDATSSPIYQLRDLLDLPPAIAKRLTVFVALDSYKSQIPTRAVQALNQSIPDVRIVPAVTGFPLYGARVYHVFRQELFFLALRNNLAQTGPKLLKRSFDVVCATLLLIVLAPFFLALIALIKADGGPAFFAHSRIGKDQRRFNCYKFRTMVPNAQQVLEHLLETDAEARREWEQDFKLKNDPRVTKVGKILRETSLDELPQLWNVLRGDMSLVGPRPIVLDELDRYGDEAAYYLEVRPGITGVWQVSGRNDTDYAYRVSLDSWYARNWSLWYDIVILVKTVRVVLNRSGAY
ncbi:hypothetical protein CKO31_17245 [Thiohalocapsa halophila]|uniref:Bacterial sugar transferase domain-containing protein n=1 Tax=Thiohalocapsa halophila TaxID=69359 RepID=A0ABS1CLV2_9GAMM|nr:undecaprenyl-phosphate galactose phosphotransferase WbaP [Thiohalocapsa halophila]MBK1632454.1 hypothetical protein [Thiohalocapsa halophila]